MKFSNSNTLVVKMLDSKFIDRKSSFQWKDFLVPSTLQLAELIELLLAPIDCKKSHLRLKLGLQEALVNAVQHGNSGDPKKLLRIRRVLTPYWLVWQIQDEGNGIPHNKRLGKLPLEMESNTGRGLFIIFKCFDDVRWSQKGNRLQLAFKRDNLVSGDDNQDPLFPG